MAMAFFGVGDFQKRERALRAEKALLAAKRRAKKRGLEMKLTAGVVSRRRGDVQTWEARPPDLVGYFDAAFLGV